MQDKEALVLRLLMNRYHGGPPDILLKALPDELSDKVQSLTTESSSVRSALNIPTDIFATVHYSWFLPKLKDLPKEKQTILLSVLPEQQAYKIRKLLKNDEQIVTISKKMKHFLLNRYFNEIALEQTSPQEFLPQSPLRVLATLDKKALTTLIDYLGLYDLAQEIHHIVDKKLLEKTYQFLTTKKRAFLKHCLKEKDKLDTQRLKLENWDGDAHKLSKLLHHKGLIRLGYALSGEDSQFQWHIFHILDSGRGEKLKRYSHHSEIPAVTESLRRQILHALDFLKDQETSS